jgi:opacity protein-like surface antigen
MKRILTGAAVLGFSVFASANVAAQATSEMANKSPIQFGVLGGASFPVSDYKDFVKTGWNAGAFLNFGVANWPVGIRIDGQWNQFAVKNIDNIDLRDIHGTADVVFNVGSGKAAKFYLLGGVGVYNLKATGDGVDDTNNDSQTKFGLNAGAGVKFNIGSLSPFIEGRYHYVFVHGNDFDNNGSNPKLQFIPVSIGLSF